MRRAGDCSLRVFLYVAIIVPLKKAVIICCRAAFFVRDYMIDSFSNHIGRKSRAAWVLSFDVPRMFHFVRFAAALARYTLFCMV